MLELDKDVETSESSTEEQVVEKEGVTTTPEKVEDSQTQETSTQEVKTEVETKPDRPEINYAMEAARKATEALEIARQLQQQQQQPVQQQPQYSKAQLRAFAEQTEDPTQKIWALEEIDRLDKVERQTEQRQLFENFTKKTQEDIQRQQSFQFVVQNFPEVANKDGTGNFIGFNQNSPLFQKIDEYMRNPQLAQNPNGFMVAAKMAAFDLGVSINRKLQNKVNQTNAQLKHEQKKQLISTGGVTTQDSSVKSKAQKDWDTYVKSGGTDKDAFTRAMKVRGLIPDFEEK